MTTTMTELRTTHVLRALLATTTHGYLAGSHRAVLPWWGGGGENQRGGQIVQLTLPLSSPRGEQACSCSGNHPLEELRLDCSPGSAAGR